jgi:ADP-ribose pyrophosphatase
MSALTEHQKEALARYRQLMTNHPALFAPRNHRPIVQDFERLETYARDTNTVLGVSAVTPYVFFVVDLVEGRTNDGLNSHYPYLRVIPKGQLQGGINVVIIATIQNDNLGELNHLVVLEQERHATGTIEMGLPRGFGEGGLSGEENALKELREETGYQGEHAYLLGSTYTDTGLTDGKVFFYHIPVTLRDPNFSKSSEAILSVSILSPEEIWKKIRLGVIRDGFTLQAIALYEKYQKMMV